MRARKDQFTVNPKGLIPMFDLAFLLVMVFTFNVGNDDGAISVALPHAKGISESPVKRSIPIITITKDGAVFWERNAVTDDTQITQYVQQYLQQSPEGEVKIRGDARINYQQFMELLGKLRSLGISKFTFQAVREGGSP